MSTPTPPNPNLTTLKLILSQTRQNISFLASEGLISHSDAESVLRKLPLAVEVGDLDGLGRSEENLKLENHDSDAELTPRPPFVFPGPGPKTSTSTVLTRRAPAPTRLPTTRRVRALWDYNLDGREINDLSFTSSTTFDLLEETNPDWWVGRTEDGRQGLFPSNHVEVLDNEGIEKEMGRMTLAPPPSYNQLEARSATGNHLGLIDDPNQHARKKKFDGMGNRLANSAVHGVGFGAGAAIGGGLIRAIF